MNIAEFASQPWPYLTITLAYLGLALPAVWSRDPERRRAAQQALETLLSALQRRGGRD
ncbi:hypothetical protein [Catenulispora yoronensis]